MFKLISIISEDNVKSAKLPFILCIKLRNFGWLIIGDSKPGKSLKT